MNNQQTASELAFELDPEAERTILQEDIKYAQHRLGELKHEINLAREQGRMADQESLQEMHDALLNSIDIDRRQLLELGPKKELNYAFAQNQKNSPSLAYEANASTQRQQLEDQIEAYRSQLRSYIEGIIAAQRAGDLEKLKGYRSLHDLVSMDLQRARQELSRLRSSEEPVLALERG